MSASKSEACEACGKNYIREKVRPILENRIAIYNKVIPARMFLLSTAISDSEKIPCLFESIRHKKLMKRAFEMLLSQEHTFYEVVGAFLKARECAFALSEELQKNEEQIFLPKYKEVIDEVELCDYMMSGGISAWF
jgi:hypothetical protein